MSPPSRSELITPRLLRRWPLPGVDAKGDKNARGAVLVIAGAPEMPGAAVLAATAALRAGAGKLQVATVRSVAPLVAAQVPEALVVSVPETRDGGISPRAAKELAKRAEQSDAVLVGPGMVDEHATAELSLELLRKTGDKPIILDAEALACASVDRRAFARLRNPIAMTPHSREMARMLGIELEEVEQQRPAIARRAARELRAVVALKGAETYIADSNGRLLCNRRAGNPGLGTSGSGDTLSGVVAGLAARGAELLQATVWGVYLHARAGDSLARKVGPVGFLARELLAEIPREMARLSR